MRIPTLFLMLLMIVGVFAVVGCSETQMQTVDKAVAYTEQVAEAGKEALTGAAGRLVPEPARGISSIVLGGVAAVCGVWMNSRKNYHKRASENNLITANVYEKEMTDNMKIAEELNYAIELFEAAGSEGNDQMKIAKGQALNPDTVNMFPGLKPTAKAA